MNTRPNNEPKLTQQEYQKAVYALKKLAEIQNPHLSLVLQRAQQGYFDKRGVEVFKALWNQDARYRPFIEEAMVYLRTLMEQNPVKTMVQPPPPTPQAQVDVRTGISYLLRMPEKLTSILSEHMKYKGFGDLKFLAKGGMGAVYLAEDLNLSRPCVIKISLASSDIRMVQAFEKEAKMAAQVSKHGSIVEIYDAGTIDLAGQLMNYYVMEHVDGGDGHQLIQHIAEGERDLSRRDALELIRDIALGLTVIHRTRMTHRDMKPANILFDTFEGKMKAKISDFGLASARYMNRPPTEVMDGSEDSMESLTHEGAVIGTPSFMPREAWEDPQSAGPAWDIHALGLIAAGLLTGHTKTQEYTFGMDFKAGIEYGFAYAKTDFESAISYNDPGLDQLRESAEDEEILDFLCRMTAREPEDRPSAEEVVAFLEEQLEKRSDLAHRMKSLKKKALLGISSLIVVAGLSGVGYLALKRPQSHIQYALEMGEKKADALRMLRDDSRVSPELLKKMAHTLQKTVDKTSQFEGFEPAQGEVSPDELTRLIRELLIRAATQESMESAQSLYTGGSYSECLTSLKELDGSVSECFQEQVESLMNKCRFELCIKSFHNGDTNGFQNTLAELDVRSMQGLNGSQKSQLSILKSRCDGWEQKVAEQEVFSLLGWNDDTPRALRNPQMILHEFQQWLSAAQHENPESTYKALMMYQKLLNYASQRQKGLNRNEMQRLLQTDATYGSIAHMVPAMRKVLVKQLAGLEPQTDLLPGLRRMYQELSLEMISYYQSIIYTRLNTPNLPAGIYRGIVDRAVPVFELILALEKSLLESSTLGPNAMMTLEEAAKKTWGKMSGEVPRQYTKPLIDLMDGSEELQKMMK